MKLKFIGTFKGTECYKCVNEEEYFREKVSGKIFILGDKMIYNDYVIGIFDESTKEVENCEHYLYKKKQKQEEFNKDSYDIFDLNKFVKENETWVNELLEIKI